MGLRLRKSSKIFPGVRLNFSKSGVSLSVGGKGHTVNFGKKGARTTVGIPGSGVSYSHYESYAQKNTADGQGPEQQQQGKEITINPTLVLIFAIAVIFLLIKIYS